ncbi:hypothetical protein SAMN05216573_12299 [Bradyrhizobium sp. Rc3b]|uniref:hypothetical protein n=1 Tax=Bradyrhizobium sp. Rc3b TaxID=1855322 RepID=UPI0008EE828A|nr:hypothetical protein [Bradyrhizobium sp. Rc3b]SFN81800.1 hypothetical protein SAMN05216573_12299 [Bradyrhizobium sp. Rc3b]
MISRIKSSDIIVRNCLRSATGVLVVRPRFHQHHTWIGARNLVIAVGRLLKCAAARVEEAVAAALAQRAAIPIAEPFRPPAPT